MNKVQNNGLQQYVTSSSKSLELDLSLCFSLRMRDQVSHLYIAGRLQFLKQKQEIIQTILMNIWTWKLYLYATEPKSHIGGSWNIPVYNNGFILLHTVWSTIPANFFEVGNGKGDDRNVTCSVLTKLISIKCRIIWISCCCYSCLLCVFFGHQHNTFFQTEPIQHHCTCTNIHWFLYLS